MSQRPHIVIQRYDSLPSTNTEAARQAALGVPEGLCIVAREQTEGRGRRARVWVSQADAGLYFSIVLRPRVETRAWPLITLMAALAVADALSETCGLETDIKWPNDIYAGGRKVCGILAETVETELGRGAVVGIGINLKRGAFPPELRDVATSVEEELGSAPDLEALLRSLTSSIAQHYDALHQATGAEELLREWSRRSSYAVGMRVRVALENETLTGTTRGLASDGALRVETDAGEIRLVRAGDVTALRPVKE
ncbi:MAG: biotin--[acetyl-CoA-carboxylase] ligase [Pyrinomonadaceae bacterium]|nr:biotin--[acetyl-CoA-carboxylase] ligase [Pyrinomonadaceae bacterium]